MKKLYRHIALAARLALLPALLAALHACCGNDLPGAPHAGQEPDRVPLRICGVATGSGIGVQTRAGATTTLPAGSIGLFLQKDLANGYSPLDNVEFTYGTPFWESDEEILLGAADAVLAAYYPYAAETVNPLLLTGQKYSDEAAGLCYVNLAANNSASSLTLNLERVYARLVLTIDGDDYPGDGYVTAVRLTGNGITPVATLDLLNRTPFTDPANAGVYSVRKPVLGLQEVEANGFTTQFTPTAADDAELLLVPTVLKGNITLTLTVDGTKRTGEIPAGVLCGGTGDEGTLHEGYEYKVHLTVKPVKLEIGNIVKTEWETVPIGDDYEIN